MVNLSVRAEPSPSSQTQSASPADPAFIAAEQAALIGASAALNSGHIQDAKEQLLPYVEQATQVHTLTTLARISAIEGDLALALQFLHRAERRDPMDREVWRLLAQHFSATGMAEAVVTYRRKLAYVDSPASARACLDLAKALIRATPPARKPPVREIDVAIDKLLAAPDNDPHSCMELAELMYVAPSLASRARTLYTNADPCGPDERDVRAQRLPLPQWCEWVGASLTRRTDAGISGRRPAMAELTNVTIFPGMQWVPILDDGKAILDGFELNPLETRRKNATMSPLLMHNSNYAELRLPARIREVDQPAVLIGSSSDYLDLVTGYLGALAVAETLGVDTDLPLVVGDGPAPLQLELLSALRYEARSLLCVRADEPVKFRRLMVASRPLVGADWIDPLLPEWYRNRVRSPSSDRSRAARRIYVSRGGANRTQLKEDEDLSAHLGRLGFEAIEISTLNVGQQIELFSNAAQIVGRADPFLANMVFAPPGAQVLLLTHVNRRPELDRKLKALATACGHRVGVLECAVQRIKDGQSLDEAELRVDLAALSTALA